MTMDLLYCDLKLALQQKGCPLCWEMRRSTRKYLIHFIREGKSDHIVFSNLTASFGLCAHHGRLLLEIEPKHFGDGMSVATLYSWLLKHALNRLEAGRTALVKPPRLKSRLRRTVKLPLPRAEKIIDRLTLTKRCQACHDDDQYDSSMAWGLQRFLSPVRGEEQIRELFRKSDPLCLQHFRLILSRAEEPEIVEFIVEVQEEKMRSLLAEVEEYLRKHDYRYAHEPYGSEIDSWIRAVESFVGTAEQAPLADQSPTAEARAAP